MFGATAVRQKRERERREKLGMYLSFLYLYKKIEITFNGTERGDTVFRLVTKVLQ